jgi:hypothetical protein
MIRKTMIGAGALVASLALVPAALAGDRADVKIKGEVTESIGQPVPHVFEGKVKSDKGACFKGVKIKLKFGQTVYDSATTGENGAYHLEVDTPAPSGIYTAKVRATDKCKGAKKAFPPVSG